MRLIWRWWGVWGWEGWGGLGRKKPIEGEVGLVGEESTMQIVFFFGEDRTLVLRCGDLDASHYPVNHSHSPGGRAFLSTSPPFESMHNRKSIKPQLKAKDDKRYPSQTLALAKIECA